MSGHGTSDHRASDHGASDHRASDHRASDHGTSDHRASDHRTSDHRTSDHRTDGRDAGLFVRPVEPADFDEVARLTVAAYEADGQLDGGHGYGKVLADVGTRAAQGEMLVAVDPATGAVLGAVTFALPGTPFAEISRAGEAEFRTLAVDPAAQRRGVARALVRACVDRAVALRASAVVISVRDFADPARRLYEEFGFVPIPELDWSPSPGVQLLGLRLPLPVAE